MCALQSLDKFNLPNGFDYIEFKSKGEHKIGFRANLISEDEFLKWKDKYSLLTKTSWLLRKSRPERKFFVFHREYKCQHGSVAKRREFTNCKARIIVRIKRMSTKAKMDHRMDTLLTTHPCFIELHEWNHNHPCGNYSFSKQLKMSEETKSRFIQLFESGLSVAAAMNRYRCTEGLDVDPERAANTAINPAHKQVWNLWKVFMNAKYGPGHAQVRLSLVKKRSPGDGSTPRPPKKLIIPPPPMAVEVNDERKVVNVTMTTLTNVLQERVNESLNDPRLLLGLQKFQQKLNRMLTPTQFVSFLHACADVNVATSVETMSQSSGSQEMANPVPYPFYDVSQMPQGYSTHWLWQQ